MPITVALLLSAPLLAPSPLLVADKSKSPEHRFRAFFRNFLFVLRIDACAPPSCQVALRRGRSALDGVARVFKRGHTVFLALLFEFFLRGLEACKARRDFFALAQTPVFCSFISFLRISIRYPFMIAIEARLGRSVVRLRSARG